jgi:CheW-like domain
METTYLSRPDSAFAAPTAVLPDAALMRFGVSIGNASVLLPIGVAAEFIAEPELFPVPRAPKGLVGMIQLRGAPVAVFAAGHTNNLQTSRSNARTGVLVIGTLGQFGAVLVNNPPISVTIPPAVNGKAILKVASAHEAVGVTPWLARAIRFGVTDVNGAQWWELDLPELMKGLADSSPLSSNTVERSSDQSLWAGENIH